MERYVDREAPSAKTMIKLEMGGDPFGAVSESDPNFWGKYFDHMRKDGTYGTYLSLEVYEKQRPNHAVRVWIRSER